MTDHRSPSEIEHDIEQERAGLTHTLEDLQERFSLDGVLRQLSDQFREHGGDIGASISRSVKDNPMAVALTGVGLAWLIFGTPGRAGGRTRVRNVRHRAADEDRSDPAAARTRTARDRTAHASRAAAMGDSQSRFSDARAEVPGWVRSLDDPHAYPADGDRGRDLSGRARDTLDRVGQGAAHLRDSAASAAHRTADGTRATAASVTDGLWGMGRSASDTAAAARARLAEGTESLGEEARSRVIAARERAVAARRAAVDYGRQGREKAADLYEEQPLIAGALAVAVGVAIGAALPRTRLEDAYMGEESDHLIHEAERILAEEKAKAGQVVRAALDEAGNVVRDAAHDVGDPAGKAKAESGITAPTDRTAADALADRAKDGGQRIAGAAKDEARRQNLATPET